MKILIIENVGSEILGLLSSFHLLDCSYLSAASSREAIIKAESQKPEIILIDDQMPDFINVYNELTSFDIPIVLLIDKTNRLQLQSAYDAGYEYIISKPIDKIDFLSIIRLISRLPKEVNILEQKKALEQLVNERTHEIYEQHFANKTFGETLPGILYRSDLNPPWHMHEITNKVEDITGYKTEDFIVDKITWMELIHPDDKKYVVDNIADAIGLGTEFQLVYRIYHKNGSLRWVMENGRSVFRVSQNSATLHGVIIDITVQKEMELKLSHRETQYRRLTEDLNVGFYKTSVTADSRFLEVNSSMCAIFGYTKEEMLSLPVSEIYFELSGRKDFIEKLFRKKLLKQEELKLKKKNGSIVYCSVSAMIIENDSEGIESIEGIVQDITSSKIADIRLQKNLREKEILLSEIHHRVKNNLQIISSLVRLQMREIDDQESMNKLANTEYRIRTMAMIHQKLYQQKNYESINIKNYTMNLTSFLYSAYKTSPNKIKTIIDIEPDLEFSMTKAIPFGLLINEFFSNSLKYAFPGHRSGTIKITLNHLENDFFELYFADDGIGLDLDKQQKESLGLNLINILSVQLGGTAQRIGSLGTIFKIIFRGENEKEKDYDS